MNRKLNIALIGCGKWGKNIARNLSISYQEPLHVLEAKGQFFYDEQGRKYLDCVNNIFILEFFYVFIKIPNLLLCYT